LDAAAENRPPAVQADLKAAARDQAANAVRWSGGQEGAAYRSLRLLR
jgi:hypothetical protein